MDHHFIEGSVNLRSVGRKDMGPLKLVNLLINTSEWEKVTYHIREFTSHTNIFLTVHTTCQHQELTK